MDISQIKFLTHGTDYHLEYTNILLLNKLLSKFYMFLNQCFVFNGYFAD